MAGGTDQSGHRNDVWIWTQAVQDYSLDNFIQVGHELDSCANLPCQLTGFGLSGRKYSIPKTQRRPSSLKLHFRWNPAATVTEGGVGVRMALNDATGQQLCNFVFKFSSTRSFFENCAATPVETDFLTAAGAPVTLAPNTPYQLDVELTWRTKTVTLATIEELVAFNAMTAETFGDGRVFLTNPYNDGIQTHVAGSLVLGVSKQALLDAQLAPTFLAQTYTIHSTFNAILNDFSFAKLSSYFK